MKLMRTVEPMQAVETKTMFWILRGFFTVFLVIAVVVWLFVHHGSRQGLWQIGFALVMATIAWIGPIPNRWFLKRKKST